MDSNQFEKERGITIASKYTSFQVGSSCCRGEAVCAYGLTACAYAHACVAGLHCVHAHRACISRTSAAPSPQLQRLPGVCGVDPACLPACLPA